MLLIESRGILNYVSCGKVLAFFYGCQLVEGIIRCNLPDGGIKLYIIHPEFNSPVLQYQFNR